MAQASFRISDIRDIETYLANIHAIVTPEDIAKKDYPVYVTGEHFFVPAEKTIIVRLVIEYRYGTVEKVIMRCTTDIHFNIENYDEIAIPVPESNGIAFKLKGNILTTFYSITISTVRGILVEKLSRSALAKVYLPVLNPYDIVKSIYQDQLENSEGDSVE